MVYIVSPVSEDGPKFQKSVLFYREKCKGRCLKTQRRTI